jgi:hypothetical protein
MNSKNFYKMKKPNPFRMLLVTTLITLSGSVFAQVKIGTNPTTIEPASNLEVEASTAGRKMKVDKTTGQLTIADGTQGAGKILTSDAVGGASWQEPQTQKTTVWVYAKGDSPVQAISPAGTYLILFNTIINNRGNSFDPATSRITVPTSGIYQISSGLKKVGSSNTSQFGGQFNIGLSVFVNNAPHTIIYTDSWASNATEPIASGSITLFLNAGDVVDMRITSSFADYNISNKYLTFIKLSD